MVGQVIVLKTGTGESHKAKAHLSTLTSCITNILVFSDLEEYVEGHKFIDVLADLSPSHDNVSDFEAYAAQKQAHAEGKPVGYSQEGWKLDRFKFLPMVDKAYQMRPHAQWYVFIETDVYYFWDTLFRMLHQLDPTKMHYMGSPAHGRDGIDFAYGGAGFVLSRGLVERLAGGPTPLSIRYEDYAKNDCCGDALLGYAIMDMTGVRLQALYPTFSGDELKWLMVNKERWISPEQMTSLWKWERTRPFNEDPLTHSALLDYMMLPSLNDLPTRKLWDNLADDVQPEGSLSHSSVWNCAAACDDSPTCLQYTHSAGTCRLGSFVRLGQPKPDTDYLSGWDMAKLMKLGYQPDPKRSSACKEATWLMPSSI
ncbi:hypothetical protein BX600DRAFT_441973 [Xylariales sp. PMI_506]|nr:hypothetical protein BX600DRAFT_441973 [Xylariales sp. PMI_506]